MTLGLLASLYVGRLTANWLHGTLPLLSEAVLCRRPVFSSTMPYFKLCPCLRRSKVTPSEDASAKTTTKPPPKTDQSTSTLDQSFTRGKITKRSFGSFELCFLDSDADATGDAKSEVVSENDITKSDVISENDVTRKETRPLVILIPWLNARQNTVYKYGCLYLERGMDVLMMKVTPMQIIRPLQTKKVVSELLDLLQDKNGPLAERPVLIHGFSIGAFVWGQLLVEMDRTKRSSKDLDMLTEASTAEETNGSMSNSAVNTFATESPRNSVNLGAGDEWTTVYLGNDPTESASLSSSGNGKGGIEMNHLGQANAQEKTKAESTSVSVDENSKNSGPKRTDIRNRIVGVIMDSPTPYENILEGIPNSISDKAIIQASIRKLFSTYMRAFHDSVTTHYIQGAHAAESNQAGFPYLLLYSSADKIVSSDKVEAVASEWQRKGLFVRSRKWEDTPHVGHFRLYPQEYNKELQKFLEHLQLTKAKL